MSQASAQYHAFIQGIVVHKKVWTLKDDEGSPTSTNLNGETVLPFWSLESKVVKIIKNVHAYRDFQPYEIKLEDFINKWIIGLEEDGLYVGVNWSGKKATGYDVKPNELLEHITYELEKY